MKQEAKTMEEAAAIVEPLVAEKKWAITVAPMDDGTFVVQWIEHKKYLSPEGKEVLDEIWTSKDGGMIHVQDMETEQMTTALRSFLQRERQTMDYLDKAMEDVLQGYDLDNDDDEMFSINSSSFTVPEAEKKTIH